MKLVTAALSILLVSLPLGTAIVCYECNSHNDSRCSDDIPPKSLQKDCSEHSEGSKYILCRKIVQNIDFEVNNNPPDVRVIRSCGWVDTTYKNRCYHRSGFGGRQEVCACDTDLCNEATHFATSITLSKLLVVLGVYAVIKKFFFKL